MKVTNNEYEWPSELLWTAGEPCRWQSSTAKSAREVLRSGSLRGIVFTVVEYRYSILTS